MRAISCIAGLLALSFGTLSGSPAAETRVPEGRIMLWNGKDLSGWVLCLGADRRTLSDIGWKVHDGVLSFPAGLLGYIRTEQGYREYRMHVEWRWPDGTGNSGIFVFQEGPDILWPFSVQVNLKAGAAGELLAQDTMFFADGRKKIPVVRSSEKPGGEWNSCDILCTGRSVSSKVNGVDQPSADKIPGTGGQIALQLEKASVEFRNIWIEPIGPGN